MIFEDFTQAEMSTTRKFGGTGLGLSIVKKLVDLLHGTIDIKSKKGHGTRVVCTIPFATGDEKQIKTDAAPSISVPEEISKLKILVVDDEEYNRLLFKKIFERWNVKCNEAANGMDALEILKTDKFDLLFIDIRMPGIDGIRTTQFIREEMKISESKMPVIFISAAPVNEEWQKYRKAGMSSFLQKPFTEEMLLTSILTVTENKTQVPAAGITDNEIITPAGPEKINFQNLYHISGSDNEFVRQMLISFINTTQKGLKEMQEAATSGQWESVANLAHKLLPPCRHLGASELSSLLSTIEKDIRTNNNTGPIETLTEKSVKEFETISELVKEHIAKMS
jgi:CheY-like chemotaxis protein/HPt (histidine-containing phosphotransfer) domain-containing protein